MIAWQHDHHAFMHAHPWREAAEFALHLKLSFIFISQLYSNPCSNNISELPEEFEAFRYLRTVRLKYCQLKRIPAVLTRLPQACVD